ncbi:MAG: hypothetical protein PQJ58_21980 [Spirochaetales bacterium]|nr:hypothetical protein [Spirochaetales bacterium]
MEGAQSDGDTSDTDYTIDEHANGIYFLIYGNTSETFSSLSEMNSRAEELGFSPFSDDNSDDNSGSVSGSYSIDGVVTGSFTSAQKEDNGSNSDSYDWDFYLYTGTLTNYAYEGNGDYFVMDLNTPDQSNFNGTYTKDSTRDALTWPLITLYTGVQGGFGYENEYNISSGQVVISESNDSFTISFSLTAFTGEIISGSYTGPVPDM